MARDVLLRLQDMREAIAAAFRLIDGLDKAALEADVVRHDACLYRILVVAEAANQLPKDLLAKYPEIEWRDLINMGHRLRHQYFRIESDIVWDTVAADFPKLQVVVEEMFNAVADSVVLPTAR